ncbi:MAG: ATP-dependent DNA helicase RecG [Candidatus Neomarinimicrobiota bacterium]
MKFSDPISSIKGVGPQRELVFNSLGINIIKDFLYYFPRRYLDRTTLTTIRNFKKGEIVNLIGVVETFGERRIRKGKMFQVIISDGTGHLTLNWFHGSHYLKNIFNVGDRLAINGKVEWFKGYTITHPEFEKLMDDENPLLTGIIVPIYPSNQDIKQAGLDQRSIRKILKNIFSEIDPIPEIMPENILSSNDLIGLDNALRYVHFSKDINSLQSAIRRLKFDEHFFFQIFLALKKASISSLYTKRLIDIGPYFRPISESLDFELTNSQKNVIKDVHLDLKRNFPMNRLIQGDVGCGKTIVAILITAIAVGNNIQVAIMAPTEILAKQHLSSFKKHLDKINLPCALLVGKMKKSDRAKILSGLDKGGISVVIGTHALIQKDVSFRNLGLVIIDEQHRFGVNQRASLLEKGDNPHMMAMTATPIPRTLAITYHGDMDISIIDELPLNRIPIITKVVEPQRMNKVYKFIREEVSKGMQCIVVYPLVEESEKSDLAAAVDAYDQLSKVQFSNLEVGLVHGKMKSKDKDHVIRKFEKNEINVLVSTTVVEVGIDIPNASVILIEHAERFGLTQLHQLRGRVGRGKEKSYCILVRRSFSDISSNRLSVMEKTGDGFIIADEDLKLRGPGEFFGLRQSGFFKFKIADIAKDGILIKDARAMAFSVINHDRDLSQKTNKLLYQWFMSDYANHLDNLNLS